MGGRNKKENTEVFAVLPSWNDEKEERFLRQKVTVMTWKMVEKIWILSKNIFGESLTNCAPSGHEKTIIKMKSREPFFKYESLRLNDLSRLKEYLRKKRTQSFAVQESRASWTPSISQSSSRIHTALRRCFSKCNLKQQQKKPPGQSQHISRKRFHWRTVHLWVE